MLLIAPAAVSLYLTASAVPLWWGNVLRGWRVVSGPAWLAQANPRYRQRLAWTLRNLSAAAVASWGLTLLAVVELRPASCSSLGCSVEVVTACCGLGILVVAGAVTYALMVYDRPAIAIPPWLRDTIRRPGGRSPGLPMP